MPAAQTVGSQLRNILRDFLAEFPLFLQLPDGGSTAEALADHPALDILRERIGASMGGDSRETGRGSSTWRPGLVQAVCEQLGDPEVDLADWLRHGAPLGISRPIVPRGVFPAAPRGQTPRRA